MGTRCLTIFKNERGREICVLYRQYDGYLDGHGAELKEFLKGKVLVNGFGMGDTSMQFNGMGCLSASVIAHFKKEIGNFYLYPPGTNDCGEEYVYVVEPCTPGLPERGNKSIKVTAYEASYTEIKERYERTLASDKVIEVWDSVDGVVDEGKESMSG